jgi:hypothetical protein
MRFFVLILAALLALSSGTALAAEKNSGFGSSLFSDQAPPALNDDAFIDAEAAAKLEPAAGDEQRQNPETEDTKSPDADQMSGLSERGSSSQ